MDTPGPKSGSKEMNFLRTPQAKTHLVSSPALKGKASTFQASPVGTVTPGSTLAGLTATPSPNTQRLWDALGSAAESSREEAAGEAALRLANDGDIEEAIRLLRRLGRFNNSESIASAWHVVLESLLAQDHLQLASEVVGELLEPAFRQPAGLEQDPSLDLSTSDSHQKRGEEDASETPAASTSSRPAKSTRGPLKSSSVEMVLRALTQAQQHTSATELLRVSTAAGLDLPSDGVLNSIVDSAVRAKDYQEAWEVLDLLLSANRRADKYWVSILTKSLEATTDRRSIRRGVALVERFIAQQHGDVDEIVFNSLLNVLGQVGDMNKLDQTLKKMAEYNVSPSAVTYGTVVKAYGRVRDIDAVRNVWREMRSRNLGVSPVTCGCVLDACVKCGQLDEAKAIFQEMKTQGIHKNTVLYATLIKGLAKSHDLMGAISIYQEMCMEGVACNLVTYNSLIDVCVRCDDLHTAAFFLQEMMQRDIKPDLITFSTLIKGYSHAGQVHKALELAQFLKDRGLTCDEIMYNSLIDGCAKAKLMHQGLAIFEEMMQARVAPSNITFSILVRLFFEGNHAEDAFALVEEMGSRYRCAPNRVVYTVLLRAAAAEGGQSLRRAATLLEELNSKKNSKMPDQGMVGSVIVGCAQHREFDLALKLVHDFASGTGRRSAGSTGVMIPLESLRTLFEALGSAQRNAKMQELMQFLRSRGLPGSTLQQMQAAYNEGQTKGADWQIPSSSSHIQSQGASASTSSAQDSHAEAAFAAAFASAGTAPGQTNPSAAASFPSSMPGMDTLDPSSMFASSFPQSVMPPPNLPAANAWSGAFPNPMAAMQPSLTLPPYLCSTKMSDAQPPFMAQSSMAGMPGMSMGGSMSSSFSPFSPAASVAAVTAAAAAAASSAAAAAGSSRGGEATGFLQNLVHQHQQQQMLLQHHQFQQHFQYQLQLQQAQQYQQQMQLQMQQQQQQQHHQHQLLLQQQQQQQQQMQQAPTEQRRTPATPVSISLAVAQDPSTEEANKKDHHIGKGKGSSSSASKDLKSSRKK